MRRLLALLALLPGLALAEPATIDDFQSPPLRTQGSTIALQWPSLIEAVQSMAPVFRARVAEGQDPAAVLTGIILGRTGGSTYSNWRVIVGATNDLLLQVNIADDGAPNWQTRATFDQSTGLTSAPAAHEHAASDVTSETFADIRISQSSVEQWAVEAPAAQRIPIGNVSAELEPGWVSATAVTQHEDQLDLDAGQVTSGQFADARISESSVTQHGYLLQSGDVFLRFSGSCPSGTTEYTAARGVPVRGADTAADDGNVPNGPGVRCDASSAPAGCGAPDVSNYSDFISTSEMPTHTHSGDSHSHTTTISSHQHTQPTHLHTINHTHQVTPASHDHTVSQGGAGAASNNGTTFVVGSTSDISQTIPTSGATGSTVTSGGASTSNSGSSGGDATGSAGGGNFGSNTASGTTGSAGGTQPMIGPFVTARFCVVD